MNFFSLLVYWKASFYSCLTVWKNKQHSDNVNISQLAVHDFASHGLMHQDIHSGFDCVKIHKRSRSLSIMEAAYLECWNNQQCNEHLNFPGQQSHFPWLFQTFPYLMSFSMIFQTCKISSSMAFQTFPGSVRTLMITCIVWSWREHNYINKPNERKNTHKQSLHPGICGGNLLTT